jgi:hypothetical protein
MGDARVAPTKGSTMSSMGLIEKFKLNRPLTKQEIADHLPQKQATRSKPFFQLSVIKMNSTFLECVGKTRKKD